jgi:acyl-CoA thioesterase-1
VTSAARNITPPANRKAKAPLHRTWHALDTRTFLYGFIFLLLTNVVALSCSDPHKNVTNLDSEGAVIVFFGDSITAGHGVSRELAFPALISEQLEIPVVNAGIDGDTTTDALARLERDVLAHDPRLVIVEFGGNDFRKNIGKEETFANLDRIVGRIGENGAIVIVLGLRIGLLRDEYLGGYKRVSKKHGALLIPNFMAGILGNHRLTLEGIHPNAEGHELIAERVLAELAPLLNEADRVRAGKRQSP